MLRLRAVSVMQLRSWIGLRIDTISQFLSRTFNMSLPRKIGGDMANVNMQLHGDLFRSWKSALKGLKLCATPRLKWGSMHGDD